MFKFWVKLNISTGEYEKHSQMIVEAPDEYEAGSYACYAESHCTDSLEWETDRQSVYDCYGEMYYCVSGVKKLSETEFQVLRQFLPHQKHNQGDLDNSGDYKE